MNHKIKSRLFKCLDILPRQYGFYFYHKLQDLFSKQSLDYKIKSTEESFDTITKILTQNGFELENKNITELGSGWLPILPYFFKFIGKASNVDTYDVNKHYKLAEIIKLNRYFSASFNIDHSCFEGVFKLPKSIQYYPNVDICGGDLKKTDLLVSRFVLEHVPPNDIKKIHSAFLANLKKGSYILHLISPSDHRAYSDSSLSLYDFLKYSNAEWDKIQTKFDYHNRLRLPQYLALFEDDFEVVFVDYKSCKVDSAAYAKFKQLKINEIYREYSDQELTAGSINILLRVK